MAANVLNPENGLEAIAGKSRLTNASGSWRRYLVDSQGWNEALDVLGRGKASLFALFADDGHVHMAMLLESPGAGRERVIFSIAVIDGKYPSASLRHLPALRLERAIYGLHGHEPVGLKDKRPWLDHGVWDESAGNRGAYEFLPAEGEGLHQIPVGPVHAGVIEPGHFRFTANGETVVRLEERLGYAHKGIERLLEGSGLETGARICSRVSGDSTVAYAIAFARAAEDALGVDVPERAHLLRALMAELERIANHCGDFGAVCNDAAFAILHAHFGVLREEILQAAHECSGHRLMMDRIVPGGVNSDLSLQGQDALLLLLSRLEDRLPQLLYVYDESPSLKDRTKGTGILKPELAKIFAAGGVIGRASGRDFDARRDLAYAPYDRLSFKVPVLNSGDVNARVWIRGMEIAESISLIRQIIDLLRPGPIKANVPKDANGLREGCGVAESFRGDVFVWIRLLDNRIARCHLRDPSWFQWPLLEAAVEGNIVADFPLCNKSFNCSYSGHDL